MLSVAVCTEVRAETLACASDILGAWAGPVVDAGVIGRLASEFIERNGDLVGQYHIDTEGLEYDGTLERFHATGPCEGDFVWNDQFGIGVLHIVFSLDGRRFDGFWGRNTPLPGQIFNGRREMSKPVG